MSDTPGPDQAPGGTPSQAPGGTPGEAPTQPAPSRLIIALVSAAIVLTVGAIVTGFILAMRVADAGPETGPVAVPAAPAPGGDGRYCAQLLPELPEVLVDSPRRKLLIPEPGVAAWGDPAIILRCGLPDPAELTCAASLTRFSAADGTAVEWLQLSEGSAVTYLAVDRPVRIAVTLPAGGDISPVQQLTEVIGRVLPEQPVCDRGLLTPTDNG